MSGYDAFWLYVKKYPFKIEYFYNHEWLDVGLYGEPKRFKSSLEAKAYIEHSVDFARFSCDTHFRIVEDFCVEKKL